MERVREFIYFGDWVSASGGCEVAMTVRARYGNILGMQVSSSV